MVLAVTAIGVAQADTIETTMCSAVRAEMDAGADVVKTRAIYDQVISTLMNADPAFVNRLSDEGRFSTVAVATNLCAMYPDETLKSATMRAYNALRGMQDAVGVGE
jgi:hypothetical protein